MRPEPGSLEAESEGRILGLEDDLRARESQGESSEALYEIVASALALRPECSGTLIDVGCGHGRLWPFVRPLFNQYVGVDLVRYESFPEDGVFVRADLDHARISLPSAFADTVVSIETVEHLENPRALMRELVRLAKPGGLVIVTTPNQLSLASKTCLLVKNQFVQFQEAPGLYPAHITALLECDLVRIATECGLCDVSISYSNKGRVPFTGLHYPRFMTRLFPRAASDNLLVIGTKVGCPSGATGVPR